jgi:1,6-anhydro-N-acetylmuramate kinase
VLVRRINERTAELGERAARTQPDHLRALIGPVLAQAADRERWQSLAAHLEAYRERWRIGPDQLAHHTPSPGTQARSWEQLTRAVIERRPAHREPAQTAPPTDRPAIRTSTIVTETEAVTVSGARSRDGTTTAKSGPGAPPRGSVLGCADEERVTVLAAGSLPHRAHRSA